MTGVSRGGVMILVWAQACDLGLCGGGVVPARGRLARARLGCNGGVCLRRLRHGASRRDGGVF